MKCWRCKKNDSLVFGFGLFAKMPDGRYGLFDYCDVDSVGTQVLCVQCINEIAPSLNMLVMQFRHIIKPKSLNDTLGGLQTIVNKLTTSKKKKRKS